MSPLRIPHLEAQLLIEHAKVIKQFDKQLHDYAIHPCACCERLHKRSCVKEVCFQIDDFQPNDVWLTIKAYAILSCPDEGDNPVYLCNYCRPKVKAGIMPGRCVINGLESPPIPTELKDLDPFTVKFLQLAKAFQTVVRLSTYTNKVPSYNSLKACRGNMFILPLPNSKDIQWNPSITATIGEWRFGPYREVAFREGSCFSLLFTCSSHISLHPVITLSSQRRRLYSLMDQNCNIVLRPQLYH